MMLVGQVMDVDGNTNALKLLFDYDQEIENVEELETVSLKVLESKSKIVKNWDLGGSGQITTLQS